MAQRSLMLGAVLAALTLAACGSAPKPAPPPASAPKTEPAAPPAAAQTSPPVVIAPPPPPSQTAGDSCGANALKYLIGRPRTEIPVPLDPSRRRVVCSECVMTQDYVPGRLTIIYSSTTGLVTSVRCG